MPPNTPGKKYPNKTNKPEIMAIIAFVMGRIFFTARFLVV
jgi:hypothetical protein